MFKGIIVFFITLTIILFPIPIKITLKYLNKVLEIFIYNKKIKLKMSSKENLEPDLDLETDLKTKRIIKFLNSYIKSFTLTDIKLIINKMANLKFKPTLILKTKLEYGFDDAAFVAILYGLINTTFSFFYLILMNFVKLKKINSKIVPYFKENDIQLEITSIIYVNLAKITYMTFIMLSCIIKIKNNKVNIKNYKGGNIHG